MTQSEFQFYCPASNKYVREPLLEKGDPPLKCRVCGFLDGQPNDVSPILGHLKVTLSWGPNALEGEIDEANITGYSVYFADNCSRKMGAPLAYVKALGILGGPRCCLYDAYSVEIDTPFPENETVATLMVVPKTSVGELSVGLQTDPIVDLWVNETTTMRALASGACRPGGSSPLRGLLEGLCMFVVLMVASARGASV